MILDIILIVIIILGVFLGYKRGFVTVVTSLVGFLLAAILAFILCNPVAKAINSNTKLDTTISNGIEKGVKETVLKSQSDVNQLKQNNKLFQKNIDTITNLEQDKQEAEITKLSRSISQFIIKGISFIAVFIAVSLIVLIIKLVLNMVFTIPILSSFNGIGGALVGLVLILCKICIVLGIISFIAPLPFMSSVNVLIDKSTLTQYLYANNVIVNIIAAKLF